MSTHPSPQQLADEKQIDTVTLQRWLSLTHDPAETAMLAVACDAATALACERSISARGLEALHELIDSLRRLVATDEAENEAHQAALDRLRDEPCEFCDVAACDLCGRRWARVHHDRRWFGGRGWRSVDFCHDETACLARRGLPVPVGGAA